MSDPDCNHILARAATTTDRLIRRLTDPPFGTETSERNLMAEAARALLDARAELDRLRADAQAAVALVVEQAGCRVSDLTHWIGDDDDGTTLVALQDALSAIRALADADSLAAVEALRKERDVLHIETGRLQTKAMGAVDAARASNAKYIKMLVERDRLASELAAAQQRERVLMEALVDQNDLLRSAMQIAKREGVEGQVASTNWDAYYNRVAVSLKRHHGTVNRARAAIAGEAS